MLSGARGQEEIGGEGGREDERGSDTHMEQTEEGRCGKKVEKNEGEKKGREEEEMRRREL